MLPRDEGAIYAIGQTLEEAIDWLCTSGTLTGALAMKAFEPLDDRERRRFLSSDGTTYETVRDALVALGLHDLASDATEGDDKCFDLFYREFGGSATVLEGDDGAGVILKCDAEASGSKLDQVVATLTGMGLEER